MRYLRVQFFIVLAFAAATCLAQTPEDTLRKFSAAWNRKDLGTAASMVVGGKANSDFKQFVSGLSQGGFPTLMITDLRAAVTGNLATATYKLSVAHGAQSLNGKSDTCTLVKSGGAWLIKPADEKSREETMLPRLAYLLANPGAMAEAKAAAKSTVCLSNLKQLALGVLMFANDYDDVLKLKNSNYAAKINPYVKSKAMFHCSEDEGKGTSYSFNDQVAGRAMSSVAMPAETVLLYEGHNGKLEFRHKGRACVAFVDGHVRFITKETARSLRWKS